MITILLGDEFDPKLREALRTVLRRRGARGLEQSWGVGGSQEIQSWMVRLGSDQITIESETFVGLTLTGPKVVVESLAAEVREYLLA